MKKQRLKMSTPGLTLDGTAVEAYNDILHKALGNEDEDESNGPEEPQTDASCLSGFIPSYAQLNSIQVPKELRAKPNKSRFKRFMDWKPFAFLEYFFRSSEMRRKLYEQEKQIEFLLTERSNLCNQNGSLRSQLRNTQNKKSKPTGQKTPVQDSKSTVILQDILKNWGDADLQHWIELRHGQNTPD